MTTDDWRALDADPRVTLSRTGSWLESEQGREDAS